MEFLKTAVKLLIIIFLAVLPVLPLAAEYAGFRRDRHMGISHKRLRLLVFMTVYVIALTVFLVIEKEFLLWVSSLGFIQWIASKIAISSRFVYCTKVLAAITVNIAAGFGYRLLQYPLRIGLKKKNLAKPKGKDGDFSLFQKIERKVLFYFNRELFFLIGKVIKGVALGLTIAYTTLFAVWLVPVMFGADWIPYGVILTVFDSGYVYPIITLMFLWAVVFFLEGVKHLEEECPEIFKKPEEVSEKEEIPLDRIDEVCQKEFSDFFTGSLELEDMKDSGKNEGNHNPQTNDIGKAVEHDKVMPRINKELCMQCIDKLFDLDRSFIINGSFFSEFSVYLFRYISMITARGDNIAIVCSSESQLDIVYEFVRDGFSKISSLYCKTDDNIDFAFPIWKILKISDRTNTLQRTKIDESSVLITTLPYLCCEEFEVNSGSFIHLLDTVIFVDTLNAVNMYSEQLSALNTKFLNIIKNNATLAVNGEKNKGFKVRYKSMRIRYIGFDDSRITGIDKVLKNLLSVDFESADIMEYNSKAMVRFYDIEPKLNNDGKYRFPDALNTQERLGSIVNMAMVAASAGAKMINIYADGNVPFGNYSESLSANMGTVRKIYGNDVIIDVNDHYYDQEKYSVAVVFDTRNDLPETVRRYLALLGNEKILLMIFSRNYMFRDYYVGNIDKLWHGTQYSRIPVGENSVRDIARKVLIKADSGGITEDGIISLCSDAEIFRQAVAERDINFILRTILEIFGISQEDYVNLYDYFMYSHFCDFDEVGVFRSIDKISLRRSNQYYAIVNGLEAVELISGENVYKLAVRRERITQNHIAGQNMIYEGNIYKIDDINVTEGKIRGRLASGGNNDEVTEYIQDREYIIDLSDSAVTVSERTKHIIVGSDELSDIYISVFTAPAEVFTKGYYMVDPDMMLRNSSKNQYVEMTERLRKQTYRRYGDVETPVYSIDDILESTDWNSFGLPANILSLKFKGSFGEDSDRILALMGVMLDEILKMMFPSIADCIAVCPVYRNSGEIYEKGRGVLEFYPKLSLRNSGEPEENTIEILIIEDCSYDAGLIYSLTESGDDILQTLFRPVKDYLSWYISRQESGYLHFEQENIPECFDAEALLKLSEKLISGQKEFSTVILDDKEEYEMCDFCRRKLPKKVEEVLKAVGGRKMCSKCREKVVGNNSRKLGELVSRAKLFIESTYGISAGEKCDIRFESSVKVGNMINSGKQAFHRGNDLPLLSFIDGKKRIFIEYDIPEINILELIVRELVQFWQINTVPETDEELAEGHIAFVTVQFLEFAGMGSLYKSTLGYYESTKNISGVGYRKLIKLLLQSDESRGNPFYLLMSSDGKKSDIPKRAVAGEGDYGAAYKAETPDRCAPENLSYYYYEHVSEEIRNCYDALLGAVKEHKEQVEFKDIDIEVIRNAMRALQCDHPEIFWLNGIKHYMKSGKDVTVAIEYGATAEESERLQKRIDEAVKPFLEGITPEMSAYDALVRLHVKMINYIDYDTIGLNRQDSNGGPKEGEIDSLRSVTGTLLDGKAVCAGYAKTMQYLANLCGIECAYCRGLCFGSGKRKGEYHAWNIVKLDGEYYHLDTTWCDQSNTIQRIKKTDIGFDYFCITTEELRRSRDIDKEPVEIPDFRSIKCNYYVHNGLMIDKYDLEKLKEIAQHFAKDGKKYMIFKCASESVYNEAMRKLFKSSQEFLNVVQAAAAVDKSIGTGCTYTYDDKIYTIRINFKTK